MAEVVRELFMPLVVIALCVVALTAIMRRNGSGTSMEQLSRSWERLSATRQRELEACEEENEFLRAELKARGHRSPTHDQFTTLTTLAHDIVAKFSLDEFDGLALNVGVKPDSIAGETIEAKARELVLMMDRRNRLQRLVDEIAMERPE